MEQKKVSLKCPVCGRVFSADSEAELIKGAKDHALQNHRMQMTDEQVKELIKAYEEGK
jgi:predicted small metal-binding protein